MTNEQRELARHALGFPNKTNMSTRNHFCTGEGSTDFPHWEAMVAAGYAIKRKVSFCGGDDIFHLTMKGALEARGPKEHLSRETASMIRELEAA